MRLVVLGGHDRMDAVVGLGDGVGLGGQLLILGLELLVVHHALHLHLLPLGAAAGHAILVGLSHGVGIVLGTVRRARLLELHERAEGSRGRGGLGRRGRRRGTSALVQHGILLMRLLLAVEVDVPVGVARLPTALLLRQP
eukprot:scaffold94390_cov63-Phaeocystis_antarctica.AAC.1